MLECSPHGRKVGWSLVPAALFHHWTLQEAILFPKLGGSLTGDVCVGTALSDVGKFRRNSETYIRIYIYIYVYTYIVWISSLCSLATFPRMLRSGMGLLPFCSHWERGDLLDENGKDLPRDGTPGVHLLANLHSQQDSTGIVWHRL